MFPIRNGLKVEDALSPLLFNLASEYTISTFQVNHDGLKLKWYTSAACWFLLIMLM